MSRFILIAVGFGVYELLSRWAKRPVSETDERYFLPRSLQLNSISPSVIQCYLDFRRQHRPWTQIVGSLSQWRFLCPQSFDLFTCHLHALTQKQTRRQITQHEYDELNNHYKMVCEHLKLFGDTVIQNHLSYCARMQEQEDKLVYRRQSIERMNKEIRFIMHYASKMKRKVDEWFLTAKYSHLYG